MSLEIGDAETRGLVGRNGAGKSTLVAILAGILSPDTGTIRFWGEPAPSPQDRGEWRRRVGTVYQHPSLQRGLTVAENLFLGALPANRLGLVSWRRIHSEARRLLDDWELDISDSLLVEQLRLDERQLVEIARELALGAKFVVLDEPTSRLSSSEIARLFERIRRFQTLGVTFMYISHHLEEIIELCDTVTVLRDGRLIATRTVPATSTQQLVQDMVGPTNGRPEEKAETAAQPARSDSVLSVRRLAAEGLQPLSFEVAAGEVLGIAGLVGSGKEALAQTLVGERRPLSGEVAVNGRRVALATVRSALDAGIAYVPPDRHRSGQVSLLSVGENITMTVTPQLADPFGFVWPWRRAQVAKRVMEEVGVIASSPHLPASALSGGNQQKAVVARALAAAPKVLVLANPTTGIDVASKVTIYEVIRKHRALGVAMVLVSDELEEYEICDRIIVLFRGRPVRELAGDYDPSELLSAIEGVSSA